MLACSCLIGGWELLVTRTASMLFYYDLAYLVLAFCLAGIAVGATTVDRIPLPANPPLLMLIMVFAMGLLWPLLYYFEFAWLVGTFTIPFYLFGGIAVLVWREVSSPGLRSMLYANELVGALAGLLLLGPLLVAHAPINVFGDVGVITHLKRTASEEGVVEHESFSSNYARTDMLKTSRDSVRYFFTDGMFVTRSVAWDGVSDSFEDEELERLAAIKRLAFRASSLDSVILLGAGAGFDIAVALQEGAKSIDAVEINKTTLEEAGKIDDWAGGVLSHPAVNVYEDDARLFMERTSDHWDQINLALLQTSPANVRGRHHIDGRVLTIEAIETYRDHLNPAGVLSIIQNTDELAAATEKQLRLAGFDHLLLFKSDLDIPFSHLLLARQTPFSEEETSSLIEVAANHLKPVESFGPSLDFNPVTDNRPFLFERASTFGLQAILVLALFLVAGGFGASRYRKDRRALSLVTLGVMSGACGMMIQVQVIYFANQVIGMPTLSLAVALAAVLGGSGIGVIVSGLAGGGLPGKHGVFMAGALALLASLVIAFAGQQVIHTLISEGRGAIAVLVVLGAICLPLGLPFLAIINRASQLIDDGESLVIGFDGLGAIFGATGATAIAVLSGFDMLGYATALGFMMIALLGGSLARSGQ